MTHDLRFGGDGAGYVSLDGRRKTVGIGTINALTTSNTRWVCVSPRMLREWAEAVEEASDGDGAVHVGVTPDRPLIATHDRDSNIGILLSPRADPETNDD